MQELSLLLEPPTANGLAGRTGDELPELDWREIRHHDTAGVWRPFRHSGWVRR